METKTIEERKAEIIGWMNHSIPRGKTVPIFEDLVEELAQSIADQSKRDEREMFARHIDEILNVQNKHTDLLDWLNWYKNNLLNT